MNKTLYDTGLVDQMSRGNKSFVKEVLRVFVEDGRLSLQAIKTGLEEQDYEKVKKEAHSMKSSLKLLKMDELADIIIEIEEIADTRGEIARLNNLYGVLEKQLMLCFEQINDDLEKTIDNSQ